jgi:hypothetical protein
VLNKRGHTAALYPHLPTFELSISTIGDIQRYINEFRNAIRIKFETNPLYDTPVKTPHIGDIISDDTIVVYPDITIGNPLQAKNIVRWFLHFPGHHLKHVSYGYNELHFIYGTHFKFTQLHGSTLSNHIIKISDIPFDLYLNTPSTDRKFTCYCLKKGRLRSDTAELAKYIESNADIFSNAICIDDLNHEEVARTFKNSTEFYCFDPNTLYSVLAAIADCKSITIPEKGINKEYFYPNPDIGKFIYYGKDDANAQPMTHADKFKIIEFYEKSNRDSIGNFESDCEAFFFENN